MKEELCKCLAMYQPPRNKDPHGWWLVSCPYCPREHRHAAVDPSRPGTALPHCGKGGSYFLIPKVDSLPSGG
jgi:hypothetical protein